jgi:hypothetical protein
MRKGRAFAAANPARNYAHGWRGKPTDAKCQADPGSNAVCLSVVLPRHPWASIRFMKPQISQIKTDKDEYDVLTSMNHGGIIHVL